MKALSEKISKVRALPDYETKDVVVREIEALENFTDEERYSIFDNSSIVWILKSYTISELKKKAEKALKKPDIHVGDVVKFGILNDSIGIVLEITGEYKDRATIMYKENSHIYVREGISCYDVDKVGNVDINEILTYL